jgi:hypothetical protein
MGQGRTYWLGLFNPSHPVRCDSCSLGADPLLSTCVEVRRFSRCDDDTELEHFAIA